MAEFHIDTRVVHPPGGPIADRGLSPPIYQSSVFQARTLDDAVRLEEMADGISSYTRVANPTVQALEAAVADLENGAGALAFPSGMAALTAVCLATLRQGDAVVVSGDCYADTLAALETLRRQAGIRVVMADLCTPAGLDAVADVRPRLVVSESITNPMLRVHDLSALADVAHRCASVVVVDNTLATPVNFQPLAWGADVVVHSASKYLAGHYAVVAGIVVADAAFLAHLGHWRTLFGACLDPHAAWHVLQGIQTLALRVRRQNATALRVATFLEEHPSVSAVWYPGLTSHPDAKVAQQQLVGGGGVVTFQLAANANGVARYLEAVRIARIAVSLGGTKTLVEAPSQMSHVHADPSADSAGTPIPADAIRMSVGIEDPDDLLEDIRQALTSSCG